MWNPASYLTHDPRRSFAAGSNARNGRIALAFPNAAQDIDPRKDGAGIIRGPTNEGKNAAGFKRYELASAVENGLFRDWVEADSVLDAILDTHELDMGESSHSPCSVLSVARSWCDDDRPFRRPLELVWGREHPAARIGLAGNTGPGTRIGRRRLD